MRPPWPQPPEQPVAQGGSPVPWAWLFVGAAAAVLAITWTGRTSDSAVAVNRAEVPVGLILLALLPLLIRRFWGGVTAGWLPVAVRAVGYTLLMTLIAAEAVEARAGQKLGIYFADGGRIRGFLLLLCCGYATALMIATSQRARLGPTALTLAVGPGVLTGAALFALYGYRLRNPSLAWWVFTAVVLPAVIAGLTWRAARPISRTSTSPRREGSPAMDSVSVSAGTVPNLSWAILTARGIAAAVFATGTAVLILAALTTATVALSPGRVPLQTPPPPAHGGCETCQPVDLVIPPGLRQEYWVGLSITQQTWPEEFALTVAPLCALLAGALGAGVGAGVNGLRRR